MNTEVLKICLAFCIQISVYNTYNEDIVVAKSVYMAHCETVMYTLKCGCMAAKVLNNLKSKPSGLGSICSDLVMMLELL